MNLLQDLTKNYVEGVGTTPYAAPFRLGAGQSGEMPSPIFRPGRKKSAELLTEPEYTSPKGNAPQRHDFKKLLAAAQKLEEKQKEEVKSTKEQLYVDNPEGMAQAGHHRLSLHAFAFRNLGLKDSHKKRIYDSRYIEQEYKAISQALGEQKKALVPKKKTYDVQNPTEPIFSMSKAIGAASKEELEEGFYLEAITPHEPEQQPLIELSSGLTQGIERAKFLIKPAAKASLDKFSQRFEREQFNEVPLEFSSYSDLLLNRGLLIKKEERFRSDYSWCLFLEVPTPDPEQIYGWLSYLSAFRSFNYLACFLVSSVALVVYSAKFSTNSLATSCLKALSMTGETSSDMTTSNTSLTFLVGFQVASYLGQLTTYICSQICPSSPTFGWKIGVRKVTFGALKG